MEEEEWEDHVDATGENDEMQAAIDKLNQILASGDRWTDDEFAPTRENIQNPIDSDKAFPDDHEWGWKRIEEMKHES